MRTPRCDLICTVFCSHLVGSSEVIDLMGEVVVISDQAMNEDTGRRPGAESLQGHGGPIARQRSRMVERETLERIRLVPDM